MGDRSIDAMETAEDIADGFTRIETASEVVRLRATLAQRDRELAEVRADLTKSEGAGVEVTAILNRVIGERDAERAAHDETKRQLAEQAAVLEEVKRELGPCPCDEGFTGRDRHEPNAVCYVRDMLTEIDPPGAEALRAHVDAEVGRRVAKLTRRLSDAEAKMETLRGAAEAYDRARYGGPEGILSGERSDIAWSRVIRALRDTAPDSPSDDEVSDGDD